MDLRQNKLNRDEWNNIEVPISPDEKIIVNMIIKGFHNVNIIINNNLSLIGFMKVAPSETIVNHIYTLYILPELEKLSKKYKFDIIKTTTKMVAMKKADNIRFENTNKKLLDNKDLIFEFIIMRLLKDMFKYLQKDNLKWVIDYYTIRIIINYNVQDVNTHFKNNVLYILATLEEKINIIDLIEMADELIEKNMNVLKFADKKLYNHQKTLFTLCKTDTPKLILYIAPTGTGKTLSPLGLSEKSKILFVCAARHVGLALAKVAISIKKKIGFAFGCEDAEDIRLHYFSAKECIRSKKSGSIVKVDNSVGDNVEIMICDIKSYLPAMHYMLAFNSKEDIILYWDEPTITLDYDEHEFHSIIHNNWEQNVIPNVVLSSATLPRADELTETLLDFKSRFVGSEIHTIISYDCNKTIPIINKECYVEMPHYIATDFCEIRKIAQHCEKYKTLLRYIDLKETTRFILYVNKHNLIKNRYSLARYFPSVESITMENIKLYYICVLNNIEEDNWKNVQINLSKTREARYKSTINVVTSDANTLTDGPTIFLTQDVDKVSELCIQMANIPDVVINDIMKIIKYNSVINGKISPLQKTLDDSLNKEKDKKVAEGRVDPMTKTIMSKIQELQACIKNIILNPLFVPNTKEHNSRFNVNETSRGFSCNIDESTTEKIMLIDDIEDNWKLLLMMGVGVFKNHNSIRYTEIMKHLAEEQKLYLIIASGDYIYGTNYQFCHGYISKDLGFISQEKCIQAMGRIGRNQLQHDYSIRFRDNNLIVKIFNEEENKPEVKNMSLLFNT